MPEQPLFFLQNEWSIRCHVEPTMVRGEGGAVYPRLVVPLTMKAAQASQGKATPEFSILGAFATLSIGSPAERIADAMPFFEPQRVWAGFMRTFNVEFALDRYRLEHVEKTRDGDVALRLDVRFMAALPADHPSRQGEQRDLFALRFEQQPAQFQFVIPQSHWVRAVLLGVGYGETIMVEIPRASFPAMPDFPHAVDELQEAHRYFGAGDYDKAVAHCRSAIEPMYRQRSQFKSLFESRSTEKWVADITEATAEWLSTLAEATYALSSKSHHPPSVGHFSRDDALGILMVATTIAGYVGRLTPGATEGDQG